MALALQDKSQMQSVQLKTTFLGAIIVCLGLFTSLASAQRKSGNGYDRGGACLAKDASGRLTVLSDFAQNGFDSKAHRYANMSSDYITLSKSGQLIGYDIFNLQQLSSFQTASQMILEWGKQNAEVKDLAELLNNTMHAMLIKTVKYRFNFPGDETCLDQRTTAVVLYIRNSGGHLSVPMFNELDFITQVGVLVHEAYRSAKITFLPKNFEISEQAIAAVTTSIVSGAKNAASLLAQYPDIGLLVSLYREKYLGPREEALSNWKSVCVDAKKLLGNKSYFPNNCQKIDSLHGQWIADLHKDLHARWTADLKNNNTGSGQAYVNMMSDMTYAKIMTNRFEIGIIDKSLDGGRSIVMRPDEKNTNTVEQGFSDYYEQKVVPFRQMIDLAESLTSEQRKQLDAVLKALNNEVWGPALKKGTLLNP